MRINIIINDWVRGGTFGHFSNIHPPLTQSMSNNHHVASITTKNEL